MRLLRLVGPGEDGTSLVLESADGDEQFTLPINERLKIVASSDLPRVPLPEAGTGTAPPTPREIQTRVRAGASAEAVAEEAGISVERVMRFAFPVLQERIRVVDEARRSRARSSHQGQQSDFGSFIDGRLSRHGLDPATVAWDSYRRADGGWTVVAAFTAHSQSLQAKFSFALMNRTVSALDALSADLLSDRQVQLLLPPMPTPVVADSVPGSVPSPSGPNRSGSVRLTAVPDHVGESDQPEAGGATGATVEATVPPAVRLGRRQKAHTHPTPLSEDDELFDQDAFDLPGFEGGYGDTTYRNSGGRDEGAGSAGDSASTGAHRPADQPGWHEPPLPLELPAQPVLDPARTGAHALPGDEPTDQAASEAGDATDPAVDPVSEGHRAKRGRRGEKPRMPSWDDILLGVRHKSD